LDNRHVIYSWGNDPAKERDYHSFWVQALDTSRNDAIPMPRDVYRFKKQDYLKLLDWLFAKFKKMPPTKFYTDATRDPTWAEILTTKLGSNVVNEYKFTQDSKLKLKMTTLHYLKAGYTFPDVDQLLLQGKITGDKAEMIQKTKEEALAEQMKTTSGDKISFDHGGEHNDLLHGFELSLQGVYDYQKSSFGITGADIAYGGESENYDNMTDEEIMINNMKSRFSKYSDDIDVKIIY